MSRGRESEAAVAAKMRMKERIGEVLAKNYGFDKPIKSPFETVKEMLPRLTSEEKTVLRHLLDADAAQEKPVKPAKGRKP